jgi:subfamily B ATP-binding cassette protein MsbA
LDARVSDETKKKRLSWSQSWLEARELLHAHRGRLLVGTLLVLVNSAFGFVLPASSKILIDDVIGKDRADLLVPLALAALTATLVQAGTGYALSQILGVAAQEAINDMRKRVQKHVARLPVRHFDTTQSGVLVSRIMNDAEGIRNLVGTGFATLVGGVIKAVVGLVWLFLIDWKLTLLIVVILALFGGLMSWFFKKLRPIFRERGKITGEITGRLTQTLGGVRVVKAYVAEPQEERVFGSGVDRLFANIKRSMTGVSASFSISTIIVGLTSCVFMVVGGRAVIADEMTLGGLLLYVTLIAVVIAPIISIASIGTQITEAFAGLDRIREILNVETEDAHDAGKPSLGTVRGDVAFEDVTFEYVKDVPVLKHVSLRAPAGSTTALVGSSGSGKSTLISLVLAFHRPLTGRITVDGRDLATVPLRDYRSQLGVVLQDNFLFDGTIAENVSFSRPSATRAEVEEVCRLAHCDEFVKGFKDGLDTVVGERGVRLSGGQRQRVAIARALLAQPRILILDEATSSLDSESEALIQDGLQRLRASRTTFVIAHRLSTIRSADQILVIEQGEIVERGKHAELLARGGRYKELHDRQYSFERELFVNPGEELKPGLSSAKALIPPTGTSS